MVAALAEIKHLGCSFIVGGRKGKGERFVTLDDVLDGSGLPDSVRCERASFGVARFLVLQIPALSGSVT